VTGATGLGFGASLAIDIGILTADIVEQLTADGLIK